MTNIDTTETSDPFEEELLTSDPFEEELLDKPTGFQRGSIPLGVDDVPNPEDIANSLESTEELDIDEEPEDFLPNYSPGPTQEVFSEHLSKEIVEFLDTWLSEYDNAVGDVYRIIRHGGFRQESGRGFDNSAIADFSDDDRVKTPNAVSGRVYAIRLLFNDFATKSKGAYSYAMVATRRMLSEEDLSDSIEEYLTELFKKFQSQLEELSKDYEVVKKEAEAQANNSNSLQKLLDERVIVGIYVYSYPHLLRYPMDVTDEIYSRTLFKVGYTDVNINDRISQQIKKESTAIPEDPIILRAYETNSRQSPKKKEQIFHEILEAAGHHWNARARNNEWFLTNLQFLDYVAELLKLKVHGQESDEDY